MALPVGFYGSLQWIGWLSLLDEVALNHWNTQKCMERIEKYNFVKYRRLKNLSIIELASKMKMSANKVMMIEKHPKKITRFNLLRLSKVLNVSAEELIYENKGKVLNAEDLTPNQIQMVVLLYRSFREEN